MDLQRARYCTILTYFIYLFTYWLIAEKLNYVPHSYCKLFRTLFSSTSAVRQTKRKRNLPRTSTRARSGRRGTKLHTGCSHVASSPFQFTENLLLFPHLPHIRNQRSHLKNYIHVHCARCVKAPVAHTKWAAIEFLLVTRSELILKRKIWHVNMHFQWR